MSLVAGIDCSTQSTKILVCDAATGGVVRQGRAPHPDATEVDPEIWWQALLTAGGGELLDDVAAVAVGGQQHGMVTLDADGRVVRPALLWNDTRSAGAAADLLDELGGPGPWVDAVGLVPVASFTVTKLRWLAQHEEAEAKRVEQVLLPHDWLTWRLGGRQSPPATDRGDASGTGYWSAATGEYRHDLLRRAFGRDLGVPAVALPAAIVGHRGDAILAAGTGDNMAAALGLGVGPGDVVVSLGTSGTVFAAAETPAADPTGIVAGFADATGRFLPLVCTLNAARVLTAAAGLMGADLDRLSRLALAARPGAGGLTLLPYLDGECTPDLPGATGRIGGLTRVNATPENLARAAVEGMLFGLADGVDAIRAQGVEIRRVLLIGGAAASPAVRAFAAGIFRAPVEIPAPAEYVALGAARQAAWALSGSAEAPRWQVASAPAIAPSGDYTEARARYARLRTELEELSSAKSKS